MEHSRFAEQEKIKHFLSKYKLESFADKFNSWDSLMTTKTLAMKQNDIPTPKRKAILGAVEEWKQRERLSKLLTGRQKQLMEAEMHFLVSPK
jgi:hypothetical protein